MTTKINTKKALIPTAIVSLSLILTGCGSDDDDESDNTSAETDMVDDEEDDADNDDVDAAPGDEAEVDISASFEDPDIGDSIEIVSAVRDFPSAEHADLIENGGEVVLVELNIVPGEDYGGRIADGNFKISWDDGADFWNNDTRLVEDEMEAADRPVLEDISRIDGGEHTGWIAFLVDDKADTYQVEYLRGAAEVIGSDETLDEFVEEVEIPAP